MSNKNSQKDIPQFEGSNDDSHAKRKSFGVVEYLGHEGKEETQGNKT